MPVVSETKTTAAGAVRVGQAAPEPERSKRRAAAACGETSFRSGGREEGSRLPTSRSLTRAETKHLGPFLTWVRCVTLDFMVSSGLHFPPAH